MSIYKHINSIEPSRNARKRRENMRHGSSWIARELDRAPECYENAVDEIGFNRPFRNVRKQVPKAISTARTDGRLVSANSYPSNRKGLAALELLNGGPAGERGRENSRVKPTGTARRGKPPKLNSFFVRFCSMDFNRRTR